MTAKEEKEKSGMADHQYRSKMVAKELVLMALDIAEKCHHPEDVKENLRKELKNLEEVKLTDEPEEQT